jgi:hypothetical protein
MCKRSIATLAAGFALLAVPVSPVAGQSPAAQPALTAEQAVQLFAEAGFPIADGRPINRCGQPSNPRVAFVDLNADGRAEAHIADVDRSCYGKPGAYFAILAQGADGAWRRLIAEDGIVGFERTRSSGWNDLSLEARDSACPGLRRFNGTDYGAPTACAAPGHATLAAPAEPAPANGQSPALPEGGRAERLARLIGNVVPASESRSWDAARAAFPGASWGTRNRHAPLWGGADHSQVGSIDLGNAVYELRISGLSDRVSEIHITGPANDNLDWEPVAAALNASGTQARTLGCLSPTGFGFVKLTANGRSVILHKFVNFGTQVPSTDEYSFVFDDPLGGKSEAEVAADRSWC